MLIVLKSEVLKFLEHSGPLQTCMRIILPSLTTKCPLVLALALRQYCHSSHTFPAISTWTLSAKLSSELQLGYFLYILPISTLTFLSEHSDVTSNCMKSVIPIYFANRPITSHKNIAVKVHRRLISDACGRQLVDVNQVSILIAVRLLGRKSL